MEEKGRVCVTGAGGYVASWLVKLLLSKGYMVHGTVRDPDDEKNSHLKTLEKAQEKLQLFKANLVDYDSLYAAIEGCSGVFHVATPIPSSSVANPETELLEPAVKGTLNVLKACSETGVERAVVVSSVGAVMMNPNWPPNRPMDEDCWSDIDYCRESKSLFNWYCISKTTSEREALQYAENTGLDVVTVCPSRVLGPLLQATVNGSSQLFIDLFKVLQMEILRNSSAVTPLYMQFTADDLHWWRVDTAAAYISLSALISLSFVLEGHVWQPSRLKVRNFLP